MPEQNRNQSKPEAAEAPAAAPEWPSGSPAAGLDARLAALGVPADVLAEAILRAVTQAKSLAGVPAWADLARGLRKA